MASLAASMEQISATLPQMLQQIESLSHRTQSMEQQMSSGSLRSAALQQPLGSLAAPATAPCSAADLLREAPPPRAPALRPPVRSSTSVPLARQMVSELEQELEGEEEHSATLTQAVLEQSKALSTLVTQIAAGETVGDFSSSSTGFSSQGAAGRQRLQQELSMQRGTFFSSIYVQMARRMQPARVAEAAPGDLVARGVTATSYLERYGGYGRCRDLGHIAWQVGMVLDHLQTDNVAAAKDALALLLVCLEKASGRREAGHWIAPLAPGRPAGCPVHQSQPGGILQRKSFCSPSGAEVDRHSTGVHKGAGHYLNKKGRSGKAHSQHHKRLGSSRSKESTKAAGKAGGLEEEGAHRGGGSITADGLPFSCPALQLHTATTTVLKALASLPRLILASRTPFASFLAQSFHIQRCGSVPASVVFPLPLADFGLFASSGPKLSQRRWRTLVRKRAMHVIIIALNYLHGGLSFSQLHLLGRRPNSVQQRAHQRLWALLTTCDSPGDQGHVPLSPGRSGAEFIARLHELEHFATSHRVFVEDAYGGGPKDFELQRVGAAASDEANLPVQPYSSLNSDRLRLVGQGKWDLAKFLDDELWLPYQEPKIMQHNVGIDKSLGPNLKKEKRSENLKLAHKWGELGLLALVRQPPHQDASCRIFNAFKSDSADRQIGDRRLANATERHLQGPSKKSAHRFHDDWNPCPSRMPGQRFYHGPQRFLSPGQDNQRACSHQCATFCFRRG